MKITGPVFAVVTPFNRRANVTYGALDEYLQWLEDKGVKNIVTNGTIGEFASLTMKERMRIVERCRNHFSGTIVNHISACSYRDCRALLAHSTDHADGVLVLPPFYYADINMNGCLAFMREVLKDCRLPAYLYNFPRHTQFGITSEMLRTLATEFECLAGIKDSAGDIPASVRLKKASPALQVFAGSDRGALEALVSGLDGTVTGGGNPVPEFLVRLYEQFNQNDRESAGLTQKMFDRWTGLRESIPLSDIAVSKAALGIRIPGFPIYVRPPLLAAESPVIDLIKSNPNFLGPDIR